MLAYGIIIILCHSAMATVWHPRTSGENCIALGSVKQHEWKLVSSCVSQTNSRDLASQNRYIYREAVPMTLAISLKRLKRGTWSVQLINYGTDITSPIGMKIAQSSRGMFLQQWWNYEQKHAICMSHVYHIYVYIYKSTTKQNNIRHSTYITLYNSRRFEYKLFFRLRQLNDWKTIRWVKYT